jgi:hypothetical protein
VAEGSAGYGVVGDYEHEHRLAEHEHEVAGVRSFASDAPRRGLVCLVEWAGEAQP